MKTTRHSGSVQPGQARSPDPTQRKSATDGETTTLRTRLAVAEETLRAIQSGEVDAVVVAGKEGDQVFTLEGAEHAYRVLIESMNEGALTLTADKMILYANQSFARMVRCPLEQVTGSSFRRFLSVADRASLRSLMKRAAETDSKIQVSLTANDGTRLPVQISVHELAKDGFDRVTISMVVTDLTEVRRGEELLRALTHRIVQAQETERGRLAVELHDNITQRLVAILFSSQALAHKLSDQEGPAKVEATRLRNMLGEAAAEMERITRELRPGVLDQMDLADVLRAKGKEFGVRTGVPVGLTGVNLTSKLPAATKLAIYRIYQEATKNIEKHSGARHVTVGLRKLGTDVQLLVQDDGIGFDAKEHAARREGQEVLGLLGMNERAIAAGGTLTVKSGPRAGTEIEVRIPLSAGAEPAVEELA